jgi:hypothetical protein
MLGAANLGKVPYISKVKTSLLRRLEMYVNVAFRHIFVGFWKKPTILNLESYGIPNYGRNAPALRRISMAE